MLQARMINYIFSACRLMIKLNFARLIMPHMGEKNIASLHLASIVNTTEVSVDSQKK